MNLHPMVVHFPIALLVVGFGFATLAMFCKKCNAVGCTDPTKPSCVQKVAYWLLSLGALSGAAAVLSGIVFTNEMVGPLGSLRNTHEVLAISTTVVALIAAGVYTYYIYKARIAQVQVIGYALYALAALLVSVTGHYGGLMVYMFR